jgi:hypothetical protein
MIPIKIQCGCGQRYAFEVEEVGGRMPYTVACPVCGIDGTGGANDYLARTFTLAPVVPQSASVPASAAQPNGMQLRVAASAPPAPVHLAPATAPAPIQRGAASHLPRVDRAQAEHEARAKVSWGDSPEAVSNDLMIQGLSYEEASALVKEMFAERAATIRRNGFKKLVTGLAMMFVPVIAWLAFMAAGEIPLKLFAVTVMIGVWGGWFMILAPKSDPGDVAEQ